MTSSPAAALKATTLLAAIVAALVLLRRVSDRVTAIHELLTDCYHDLRAMRVTPDRVRAPRVGSTAG